MSLYQYPNQRYTSQLGLSLYGMDEVLAENFLLIDGTFGAGGTVNVNGALVANPNFNGTTPAAPGGDMNVTFQVDINGNVSAYVPIPAAAGVVSFNGRAGIVTSVVGDYAAFYDALGAAAAAAAASLPRSLMTTAGDMIYEDAGPTAARLPIGTVGQVLTVVGGLPTWATPAATGTVTSFSAGALSPLFTTSVATATTTPALTFSLSNAAGGTVFGNNTTGAAAPGYTIAPVLGIPGTSTGTIALASSTASGKFTITAPASASTPTFTLPTSSGVGVNVADGTVFTATIGASGTLALATQTANFVFAGPSSAGPSAPTFRALVAADLPANLRGTVTSVSFTGGLISVATANTTPALTVAGTSGGIPYFSSTTTWASSALLAATGLVIGGGAGAAPATNTALTFTGATLTVGLAGTSSGILALTGSTSGTATITAPAVADTVTNPIVSSNYITAPVFNATTGFTIGGAATLGNVLVGNGTNFVSASPATLGVAWSSLTNATAALTLDNHSFSSTFNQSAGDIWTWGLPSYTAAVSNSPTLELAGSYKSGAGTFAKDFWTIINTPTVGITNGVDKLIFTHSGTTGAAYVGVPALQFATSATIDVNANGWSISFTQQNGTGNAFSLSGGNGIGGQIKTSAQGLPFQCMSNYTTQTTGSAFSFGNMSSFTGTSGTVIGVEIGGNSGANGVTTGLAYTVAPASGSLNFIGAQIDPTFTPTTSSGSLTGLMVSPTFNPAAGSSTFVGVNIAPTVQGTSSGATTALLVNPTLTVTNLAGMNLIADFQSGGVTKASIDYGGFYYSLGTKGVTQTAIAVGTLATIGGIVTTFTGVSDERLKDHTPYAGGLEEILGITPIRFTYNELGQKFGGWDKGHVYVGFSAQNVQKSIPEAIQGTEGPEQYLSFDDRPVIAALVNAVKELTARIKVLEAR